MPAAATNVRRPTMQIPKPLLIVLIVVIVLFVAGVVLGATQGTPSTFDTHPSWVEGLGGALVKGKAISSQDFGNSTCTKFVIPTSTTCTFPIQGASAPVRPLKIQLTQGSSADVSIAQEGAVTATKTISTFQVIDKGLDVYQK